MKKLLPTTILTVALLIMAASISAEPPQYINYQGRLTDDAGEPITNTSPGVVMTFTIWNDETASDPSNEEWSSSAVYVPVENGFFDFQLGPLPANLFRDNSNLWLGITIAADAEIDPRTKMISAAYACHAGTVDDIYVDAIGDVMTGDLIFDGMGYGNTDAIIDVEPDYANIELYDGEVLTTVLWGWGYGGLTIYHANDGLARADLESFYNGGVLGLADNTGTGVITLDAGATSDYSAIFPEDAVNSYEILDEPGIAGNTGTGSVTLGNAAMTDIQTVTIEIPSSGYIYLEGWCLVSIGGSSSGNYAYIQIDETTGGGQTDPYFTMVGMEAFPSSDYHYYSVYVNRIYFKEAGTHDFILEGRKIFGTHTISCSSRNLTATYYPTSYTPIKAFSSSPEGHPEAKAVTAIDPITKDEQTVYEIDLRYYELKAKEAKIKALEAELELQQAQREAARNNR